MAPRSGPQQLRDSERRFHATFEQAAVGIAHVAPDGRWLRVNRKLCRIVGYTREELLALSFQDITHPDDLDTDLAQARRMLAGEVETYALEKRYLRKGGEVVWINLTVSLVHSDDGTPDYFIAVVEDISRRKASELALKRERDFAQSLFSTAQTVVLVLDTAGRIVTINPYMEALTGYSLGDVRGREWFETFLPARDAARIRDVFLKAIGDTKTRGNVNPIVAKDGREIEVEWYDTTLRDGEGRVTGLLSIGVDVTQRVQAEAALRASRQKLLRAQFIAGMGDFEWNIETGAIAWSDAMYHLLGYEPGEPVDFTTINARIHHPDDLAMVTQWLQEGIAGGADRIGPREYRLVHKDGVAIHVQTNAWIERRNGAAVTMYGTCLDISERKQAERLGALRRQLAEMVYSESEHALMQTALDVAEEMTDSKIGFFHFVERDQETVSLQTWSTRTLREMCFAKGDGLHYPVSQAGVWVDCIHQRRAVIHNDYAALPHKKGLPEGHAPLRRELTVPVFREERIVAVMGVGNKDGAYDDRDLDVVTRVADAALEAIERRRAEQQIQFMAYNDVLTGLPNRQLFADRFRQAASLTRRSDSLLAVCYLDLDGFKPVNDRHGHETGDELLIQLAARLKRELREGDTLARLGGDEFALLLGGLGNLYHGEEIIQRLLDTIAQPFEVAGVRVHISASIGATLFPHDDADPDTLLRHADQAMYQAKEGGKNTYRLFDPIQDRKVRDHRKAITEFEQALEQSQLRLHYQPRIDLRSGALESVEALVRWQHPQRSLLAPGAFLPTIAGTPLEIVLDEWVMATALDQHMRWREQGLLLPVSVNLSPRHIQQPSFPDYLRKLLSGYPADVSGNLELEVLETSAIGDTAQVADIMNACAELGVRFSLDDFGTGYSSLTYFHRLPISVVKIDQNFVRHMLDDPRDQDIVEGVLRLADALKRPVVAEGVETIELGLMLSQLGCQYAQGYGIARPMPAEALFDWSRAWPADDLWHALGREADGLTDHYDLNVAIFTHRLWLRRVAAYIRSGLTSERPELDAGACQFARWYGGIGFTRFGDRPQYAFLQARHAAVHTLAGELVAGAEANGADAVIPRLGELEALGAELVALLGKLSTR